MNARDYLEDARTINASISRAIDNIKRCEDMLEIHGIAYDKDGSVSSSPKDINPAQLDLMIYHDDMLDYEKSYIEKARELDSVLAKIRDGNAQIAVEKRYVEGWGYKRIGDYIGYSRDGVEKMIRRTLEGMDAWISDALYEYRHRND